MTQALAGHLLVECLIEQGITHAFGVPGESYLAVLDGFHAHRDKIRFVINRQEGGAAYMADAQARVTGRPGVCFVTRGPGATNASIGIHTAFQDSTPLVLFVGDVGSDCRDREALVGRAGLETSLGSHALAVADLDAAIKLSPEDSAAFYNRGYARFALGDYERAKDDYSMAIAIDPKMARAYNNRCLVRAILGVELVRALGDCDTALKLSPLNLEVRATRGFVFLKLGDAELALNEYNLLLDADPNRAIALYGRGWR